MKMCYRGVEYDYTPPALEVTESEILGQYRGRSLRFSYAKHIPFPQPVAELKFRGSVYRTNAQGAVSPAVASSSTATLGSNAVGSMAEARRQLLQESARIHQDNVRRTLEQRIEAARSRGNDSLLRQLEDELHQFA
ncbi:MAG: DUF4278 domain-containing protein [Cyanobacteria bacterium]|nr:DUF4278 domain-containing protein [Cyanobacteriota bacterium]